MRRGIMGRGIMRFANEQSMDTAKLLPVCAQAPSLKLAVRDAITYYMGTRDKVLKMCDIPRLHLEQYHYRMVHELAFRTFMRGRQGRPDLRHLYPILADIAVTAIADARYGPIPARNVADSSRSR
jgi:hypothetical protein